jgi:L-ascorbate metabolism protein UlaG (beta-lactamase superfamily)
MVITWYGQACFKIQSGDKTVIIDPFSKKIGLTPPTGQADIVLVTHDHFDHNNIDAVKGEYFLINGPGEYEVKGVKVRGILSFHDSEGGTKRGVNTLYVIELEGIRILHAGDLGQELLDDYQLGEIGEIHILLIPVGGFFTIDGKAAAGIVNQVEPKIAIPMHYKVQKLLIKELGDAKEFLEELGEEEVLKQEKLAVKHKDFLEDQAKTKVVMLSL